MDATFSGLAKANPAMIYGELHVDAMGEGMFSRKQNEVATSRLRGRSSAAAGTLLDPAIQKLRATVDEITAVTEDADRARLTHLALAAVCDEIGQGLITTNSAALHVEVDRLLREHIAGAKHLSVAVLARWLARNYAADDGRPRVPITPYLEVLGEEGIAQLTSEVAKIDRFTTLPQTMSSSTILNREVALHTADSAAIVREFGGSLERADQYLGVARAFMLANLPLQAEVYARRGARLTGSSALSCRMIVAEFMIERDPACSLPEIQRLITESPTREVAAMIHRAAGPRFGDIADAVVAILGSLEASDQADCLLGLGDPIAALEALGGWTPRPAEALCAAT